MNFSFKILLTLAFMVTTAQAGCINADTDYWVSKNKQVTTSVVGFCSLPEKEHNECTNIQNQVKTHGKYEHNGYTCIKTSQVIEQTVSKTREETKDDMKEIVEDYFDGKEFGAKYFKIVTPKELFFISAASITAFLHSFYYMRMCKRALKDAQDTATVMVPVVHLQLITNLQHIMQDGLAWIVPEFDKSWNPFTWFSSTVWLMQAVSILVIALVFVFVVLFLFKKHACKIFSFVGLFLFLVLEPESWAEINGFSALGFVLSFFWIWACRLLCLTNWTKDMDEYWRLVREDIIAKHLPRFPGEATEESQDFSKFEFISDEEIGQRYAIKRD